MWNMLDIGQNRHKNSKFNQNSIPQLLITLCALSNNPLSIIPIIVSSIGCVESADLDMINL